MDTRINSSLWLLRLAFGTTALLAGLDRFFNLLTDWEKYASPLRVSILPLSSEALMELAGARSRSSQASLYSQASHDSAVTSLPRGRWRHRVSTSRLQFEI